ncbi:unnamed protein product [Arabidopsis thaliana]|uniref:Uncharacterized protein n=1 Tax=Arabidopsis thaliana TaxID=3702 RepID=A0A654EM17_ARATH|nr:unnamed protein product [Arabidopsis thaliana]
MEPALPLKMDLDRPILPRYGMLDQYHYEIIPLNSDAYSAIRYENRPTGPIPSLMLDLEVYTGAIDDFDFEDYLNVCKPSILVLQKVELFDFTILWVVLISSIYSADPRESKMLKPVDFHHHVMEVGPNAGEMILAAPSSSSGTKTLVESFNNKLDEILEKLLVFRSIAETEPSDVKLGLDLVSSMKEELELCPSTCLCQCQR